MPVKNGTGTNIPDVPSPEESMFGDSANGAPIESVENQDADEQDKQDTQGPEDSEEQDANNESTKNLQDGADPDDGDATAEELKVVVSIKEGRAVIGVQRPSSDPYLETFGDADLSGLAQEVTAVVERANARWEESLKHPAYVRPAPPARRRNRRQQDTAQETAADPQQAMRLL